MGNCDKSEHKYNYLPGKGYILFIASNYKHPSETGSTGGTISNYHCMEQIAKLHRVVVLHLEQDGESAGVAEGAGVEIEKSIWPRWRGRQLAMNWLPFVHARTSAIIRERGVPLAIFATTDTVCALGADLARGIPGAVIVQAFENFGLRPPNVTWSTRISLAKQAVARRFSDGRYMRKAKLIATNSAFMANCLGNRFGIDRDKVVVIPQLCDVDSVPEFSAGGSEAIGFVNRSSDKNLGLVLVLASGLPDRPFVVYGTVPSGVAASPPNVDFRGWDSDRNRMFAQAGLWIVPSSWPEPFGRVSIEAQAANRRVLVADIGGLPETVADPRYLISGYDPQAWVARIQELTSLPEDVVAASGASIRERFSAAAHERAVRGFMGRLLAEDVSNESH